jgi:hypothetical protein
MTSCRFLIRSTSLVFALSLLSLCVLLSPHRASAGLWQDYKDLYDQRIEEFKGYDIWGNTFLPPAGMFFFQYKYNTIRSNSRFDADNKEGPILAPIDIFGGTLDLGPKGKAKANKFQFLCGLGRRWAFGVEAQVGTLDLEFDVKYQPPKSLDAQLVSAWISRRYGTEPFTESIEGLWQTIELLGHPRPVLEQQDKGLKMNDIGVAVGCNYYRTNLLSCLAAVKVSFPTGHIADSNLALIFALGPDLDVGVGSYGFEIGHLADLRLPKPLDWIVFMSELYYSFYTSQTRDSPTVFTPPDPYIQAALNTLGVDVGPYFPDLSNMDPEYKLHPGSKVRGVLQVAPTLFGILPISLGIQGNYTRASEFITDTPEFIEYINAVGLVADSWLIDSWVKLTLGLFPLRIPVAIAAGFNMPIAGRNNLIYKDNWEFTFQFYSPWFFGEQIVDLRKGEKKP